jgi:hypothetical protein
MALILEHPAAGVALHKHTYFMEFQHVCFTFKTCWISVCKDWYKVSCVAI